MHNTRIHFYHTLTLTSINTVIVNRHIAVAQTMAALNENHNKIINTKDSKHKDLINRHKMSHEKSLNTLSKKSERKDIGTEKEVNDAKKVYLKESSNTIMELAKQSKILTS